MECKKCGGHMTIDYSEVLTSLPPMYKAKCDKCGSVDYVFCHECSDITKEEERQILGHEPLTFEQMKEIEAMNLQHDWDKLRNEYAGLAMQAMISSHMTIERLVAILKDRGDENATLLEKLVADRSVAFANALVEALKKKQL